jgi:hypothetical protein
MEPHRARFTHHVQGGDTEQLAGVVHAHSLEDLSSNGHGGVHGVGDDVQQSLRRQVSNW